eukprot:scaffold47_cov258-Pinguiococcus_pyrenoidosus.AAC.59
MRSHLSSPAPRFWTARQRCDEVAVCRLSSQHIAAETRIARFASLKGRVVAFARLSGADCMGAPGARALLAVLSCIRIVQPLERGLLSLRLLVLATCAAVQRLPAPQHLMMDRRTRRCAQCPVRRKATRVLPAIHL